MPALSIDGKTEFFVGFPDFWSKNGFFVGFPDFWSKNELLGA
jgi:hypothetical protein